MLAALFDSGDLNLGAGGQGAPVTVNSPASIAAGTAQNIVGQSIEGAATGGFSTIPNAFNNLLNTIKDLNPF
jgi:hypothetical protein